jgi:hypothetical protein
VPANNANEITVGANGRLLVAAVGVAAPADIGVAAGAGWELLGYVNDEGVTFTVGKEIEDINVWQSFFAVRRIMTGMSGSLGFALVQWNATTLPLAFGGGAVSEPSPGAYRYTPPEPGEIDERALILEFEDGDRSHRIIVPRGMVTEDVETTINKSAPGELPIAFGINGQEGVAPWYLDSDAPALAPAGSS